MADPFKRLPRGKITIVDKEGKEFEWSPVAEYMITDIDDENESKYYGLMDADGNYIIMREINKSYRYFRGSENYENDWENRASKTYQLPNIF